MQFPTATTVRGYQAWHAFGRQVRHGEHSIKILAPAGSKTVDKREAGSDQQGAENDGESKTVRRFFRLAHVFDISQTEPITDEVKPRDSYSDFTSEEEEAMGADVRFLLSCA